MLTRYYQAESINYRMKYYKENNYRMYLVFIFLMSKIHPYILKTDS